MTAATRKRRGCTRKGGKLVRRPGAGLTPRQAAFLRYLFDEAVAGRTPTIRELCRRFRISSPNGVVCHLRALRAAGWIGPARNKARAVTLAGLALRPVLAGAAGERLALALGEGGCEGGAGI